MIPVYADVADYEDTHGPVVGDAASTLPTDLQRAAALVRRVTTSAVYDTDCTGLPTDPDILDAMRAATIDTARALLTATDDEAQASPAGPVQSITQGGRSVTYAAYLAAPTPAQYVNAGRVTPDAWNILRAAGLTGWGLR